MTARGLSRIHLTTVSSRRVQQITADLHPKTTDPAAVKRLAECKKVFEKFCTVTESVRKGINVVVNVNND